MSNLPSYILVHGDIRRSTIEELAEEHKNDRCEDKTWRCICTFPYDDLSDGFIVSDITSSADDDLSSAMEEVNVSSAGFDIDTLVRQLYLQYNSAGAATQSVLSSQEEGWSQHGRKNANVRSEANRCNYLVPRRSKPNMCSTLSKNQRNVKDETTYQTFLTSAKQGTSVCPIPRPL